MKQYIKSSKLPERTEVLDKIYDLAADVVTTGSDDSYDMIWELSFDYNTNHPDQISVSEIWDENDEEIIGIQIEDDPFYFN